jgi:hypothetical protein
MSLYLNAVRDELLTLVGTAWPEVVANGIYRGRDLARIPFDEKAGTGELPLVVLDLEAAPNGEWGLANRVDAITARIYRVGADSESPDDLVEALEGLRAALWPTGFSGAMTSARILDYPEVSDSLETTPNRYFLMTGKPFYSGMVTVRMIAGVTP